MTKPRTLILLLMLGLAGCVPSLHPLYTPQTLVYDPAVVGTWQQEDSRWVFEGNADDKSYVLTIVEKEGPQSKLTAHLVEIDGHRFFDFYPADDAELEAGQWLKFHIIPVHLFFRVDKTDTTFRLAAMNPDEIGKMLEKKPDWIKHERIEDGRVVLTDTPEHLQRFVLEGLQAEDFFGDPVELTPAK